MTTMAGKVRTLIIRSSRQRTPGDGAHEETELSSEEVFEGRFEKQQKLTGQSPEAKQKERGGYSI